MSSSGLGPTSQLVPHCSCRSKLSSLESQAIRTPSCLRQDHVWVLAALCLFVFVFSPFLSRSAPRISPKCLSIYIIPQFLAVMLQLLLLSTLPRVLHPPSIENNHQPPSSSNIY
ncbi:hypothetical protein V6N11_018887 [Hibiscus sabdariffa]|uniref:Uncharacterized protein n=1 Tax=Hibiscus sabdariffa TaxID=183260 RepID=A0ABR2R0W1_9ROSI